MNTKSYNSFWLKWLPLTLLLAVTVVSADKKANSYRWPHRAAAGHTIESRFAPPAGYRRSEQASHSFGTWLRGLPLLKDGAPVLLYNGSPKWSQDLHAAVDVDQAVRVVLRLLGREVLVSALSVVTRRLTQWASHVTRLFVPSVARA